ncbi:MAG: beta-Ala-His dipeptidase [Tissierellia bacterium]|nr:beta-Ala-His dipeptidase [Tissierellia bacterium]
MDYKLEPKEVFRFFREISDIPRCSGNEKAIADYLVAFAEERDLDYYRDAKDNLILRKEGSFAYENEDPIILQGHMDMVCEKDENSCHNFEEDPIQWEVQGDLLTAKGTTLGADDGIAVAMALAILDGDYEHPPLEVLITTNEETDMSGALSLEADRLQGRHLINIDSEEEGILTVGSAGGATIFATKEIEREDREIEVSKVEFSGLLGGHSGMEIHRNRGNIMKIMAKFLEKVLENGGQLCEIHAGTVDNAIPKNGYMLLHLPANSEEIKDSLLKEFQEVEGSLGIVIEKSHRGAPFSKELSQSILGILKETPTGVHSFVNDSDLVESSNNLALIHEKEGMIYLENSLRSAKDGKLVEMEKQMESIAKKYNFCVEIGSKYPAWEYVEDSKLRKKAERLYKEMTGREFDTVVVHAGLECGAIASKYPKIDMISIGPNITGAHTPKEDLSISSTKRVFDFILALLKEK